MDSKGASRRESRDGGVPMPPKQVVGFHIEGKDSTPTEGLLSSNEGRASICGTGSPTPVIIPPTFQSLQRGESREATPQIAEGSAAASGAASGTAFGSLPAGNTSSQQAGDVTSGIPSYARPMSIDVPIGPPPSVQPPSGISNPFVTSPSVASAGPGGFDIGRPPPAPTMPQPAPVPLPPSPAIPAPIASGTPSALHGFTINPQQQRQQPQQQPLQQQGYVRAQQQQGQQQHGAQKPLKEMTKAERRVLQEAQRAAKAKEQEGGGAKRESNGALSSQAPSVAASDGPSHQRHEGKGEGGKDARPASRGQKGDDRRAPAAGHSDAGKAAKRHPGAKSVSLNSTELFTHLQQYQKMSVTTLLSHKDTTRMHPAVLQLGLRYADGSIKGSTARCLAMLHTFCQVIQEYVTPPGKSLSRDLIHELGTVIDLLKKCRPLAHSMANTIKRLKMRINNIDVNMPEAEAKKALIEDIRRYIEVQILAADKYLVDYAVQKVSDGDVILTFAYSHIVANVLIRAAEMGRNFKAMVVDCRPELEGQLMLKRLQASGIACSYVHLNALSFVFRDVTKVFLGASAVMPNGTVMGRAGNAAVAMMANAHSKPVLVCCESFKFQDRVQLDSITHNELGDPDALVFVPGMSASPLAGWQDIPRLGLLNLKYDAMPAEYVNMICTEYGMIPPTSVPVILREQQQDASSTGYTSTGL